MPRQNAVLTVVVEGQEVLQHNMLTTVAETVSQDFAINWIQVKNQNIKAGTVSAKDLYQRSEENQKLFDKAISALKDDKSETAITLLKQIIKADPKDFISWTHLGNIYLLTEKFADAEESFTKALTENPKYLLAMLNLAKAQIIQKETDKAIATLTKLVETEPKSADAQHFLGEAYLQAKKGSKAVIYLNEAIRLAPIDKAEVHLRLAALYNGAGLKDRAAAEYKQFLEKVPKHPDREKFEKYVKENLAQK